MLFSLPQPIQVPPTCLCIVVVWNSTKHNLAQTTLQSLLPYMSDLPQTPPLHIPPLICHTPSLYTTFSSQVENGIVYLQFPFCCLTFNLSPYAVQFVHLLTSQKYWVLNFLSRTKGKGRGGGLFRRQLLVPGEIQCHLPPSLFSHNNFIQDEPDYPQNLTEKFRVLIFQAIVMWLFLTD